VSIAFYSAVDKKIESIESYDIGYACLKVLSRLPDSHNCNKLIYTLVQSCGTVFNQYNSIFNVIMALNFMLKNNPLWLTRHAAAFLDTYISLAIERHSNTKKGQEINLILQKLVEYDAVFFEKTTIWWDAQFSIYKNAPDWLININPPSWSIPENEKIKWIYKILKPALDIPNGVKILNKLSTYKSENPIIAKVCFDLMSEKQGQECTQY